MHDLEFDAVLAYLMRQGLVEPSEVVDGGLVLRSVPRRNANFKVARAGRTGYLVKQAFDQDSARTLRVEARVYSFLRRDARTGAISDVIPAIELYDEAEQVLVVHLVEDAHTLIELARGQAPLLLREVAPLLGRAIALVHTNSQETGANDPSIRALTSSPPWVLSLAKPGPEILATLTPGAAKVLRTIQKQQDVGHAIQDLRSDWRGEVLVHGDIRGDNVLVAVDPERMPRVVLVDWELAHLGDPAWDVACAFADLLHEWVCSMAAGRELSAIEMAMAATLSLSHVQKFSRNLWGAYVRATNLEGDSAQRMLHRSVRFCGARLIQRAYESAKSAPNLPNHGVLLLQLAVNVITQPEAAAAELLSVPTLSEIRR